jgi:hypothetical protein
MREAEHALAGDPVVRVLADRALYLGAVYTIIRAYRIAGTPAVCDPLGSYGKWTSMVRAPLIWLEEADPVDSMEVARDEDPDLASLREVFAQWQQHLAAQGSLTAFQIKETACEQDSDRKPIRPEFNDLLIRIAGDRGTVSTNRLGRWLHRNEGRVIAVDWRQQKPQTPRHGVTTYRAETNRRYRLNRRATLFDGREWR